MLSSKVLQFQVLYLVFNLFLVDFSLWCKIRVQFYSFARVPIFPALFVEEPVFPRWGNYFTILYWFCHTSTCIHHRYTRVPHPKLPSLFPPRTIPLGGLSAPAPSIQYDALSLDWRLISHMIIYMFQCHSPQPSHPHPLPQNPKDCSIYLCLFCCLAYRVSLPSF